MTQHKKHRFPLIMAALVSLVGMSGCLDKGVDEIIDPLAPIAVLEVDRTTRFAGESFTFDAQASKDPNGNITKWVFDFGDGNTVEVEAEDEARVKHSYETGGVFNVTLTVIDDGVEQPEPLNATKVTQVIVDEKHPLDPMLVAAAPDNQSSTARVSQSFDLNGTAERFELDLVFDNQALVATSRVHILVVDPEGNTIIDETITLDPNESKELTYDEEILTHGEYTLDVMAESGAADGAGELRVFHAAPETPEMGL